MEDARKKIYFCLFFVVLTAVVMGILYYHGQTQEQITVNEGTLIANINMESGRLCR